MKIFQNYHRHSCESNIKISDSVVKNEDYAKRASELGHGIISTMEHGWQGRYIEGYELAKQHNLKFLFGTEAYWVKNRFEKDNTNAHICIFAQTENARQCINDILAEANISGFYYQPRIDLDLIYSLPKEEVWITSACVAFWKYKDFNIAKQLSNHFGKNFYLEVQNHNTEKQIDLNKHILDLSSSYNIPLIMGCDSHYITQEKAWERDEYLASKGMFYEDEEGWFMDYPDGDMAIERFKNQNVLSDKQIEEAIDNTNVFLNVCNYDNEIFNKEIKMPTIYGDLSQDEKDDKYEKLIWNQWNIEKNKVPTELHSMYIDEIKKEIEIVKTTKHSDYFLLDYKLVKDAVAHGGLITDTGRGSGVSFYTNKLLGFTKVDRIASPVKMYPERFMSATRILESKSLADLDLNLANPEVFIESQRRILGETHAYPMIAYGTMKAKSAWKMYAKAKNVDFDLANSVSDQIARYEEALKQAGEEDDEISVYDYVDEEYHDILRDSENYLGIISDVKPHPCGNLIYQQDIRRNIGLIKTKSKSGGKEVLCTVMDGKWAEDYKFLKNDLLKVSVVELIKKTYERIGITPHDVNELIALTKDDSETWRIYEKGYVVGINQVERNGTKHRMMQYKAKNISELCAFVAAIRPGFKSMYKIFANREEFDYGIPTFDKLIQTDDMPNSFMLYQEMAMNALNFAGVPMSECYDVIKNIAKKRAEKVLKYKKMFLDGFTKALIENEGKSQKEARDVADKIWQIISDSVRYSFNASHSFCVAMDSLYGAYLKSHYPLEFYEVLLNILDKKSGEKDRINTAMSEAMDAFSIQFLPVMFGQDNRKFTIIQDKNMITRTIKSIKGFGESIADTLYEISKQEFNTFVDLLVYINENSLIGDSKVEALIKLNYFLPFGKNKRLLNIFTEFSSGKNRYNKKHAEKTKQKRLIELYEIEKNAVEECLPIKEQVDTETELLGCPMSTYPFPRGTSYILELDMKNSPKIKAFGLSTGKIVDLKVYKRDYNKKPFYVGDIVQFRNIQSKQKVAFAGLNDDGKPQFEPIAGEKDLWSMEYTIMKNI